MRVSRLAILVAAASVLAACASTPPTPAAQAAIDKSCQTEHCYCNDDTMSQMNPDRIKAVQSKPDGTRFCPTGQRLVTSNVQDGNLFLVPHLAGGR